MKKLTRINKAAMLMLFIMFVGPGTSRVIIAQNIASLENKLASLLESYNRESADLNLLKQNLSSRVKEIDAAKKSGRNESEIKNMLAASVTMSDKIELQQKKLDAIAGQIKEIKKILDAKYTNAIDSLSNLDKSENYKGNEDDLKSKILLLTEKRLRVAPEIGILSFEPGKILEINLRDAKTDEEKIVFSEYLNEALNELETQLTNVKKIRAEVDQIINLQEKTSRFMEDVEFDSDIGISNLLSGGRDGVRETDSKNTFAGQAQSFLMLIKQLDVKQIQSIQPRGSYSADPGNSNLSLNEYAKILHEAEQKLSDYKTILKHRLGNTKK